MCRNYSLAYFMSENKCFPEKVDIKKVIDWYAQVCKAITFLEMYV
jgi:glutaminase